MKRREYEVDFEGDSDDPEWGDVRTPASSGQGNVYSSEIIDATGALTGFHAPCVDIDFPCRLEPSTTPGHFHLYIDHALTWEQYEGVLVAMVDAGLVEPGYLIASCERSATFVRKPGVKKERPYDPSCKRYPDQIPTYVQMAEAEETTPDKYVKQNEGTYNRATKHFLCDECYIKAGQPSSPAGWKCP